MSKNYPLVTIGVLSYNYSNYIVDALDSILLQTYKNVEIIIVDDCSSDECPVIIEDWIRKNSVSCTFIKHEKNVGITKTSNEILALARGKYITMFATDDIMLPERIEKQVDILEEAGEAYGMCYANVETMDENGNDIGYFTSMNEIYEGDVLQPYVFNKMSFATPSSLIRRKVYSVVGRYDERILIEDYNFWLRFMALYKVKYCPYPCLRYRIKKESLIWNKWWENKKERYYYDRILSNLQGLKVIKDKVVRSFLKKKVVQYSKALAVNNSTYSNKSIFHLISCGYFQAASIATAAKIKQFLFRSYK